MSVCARVSREYVVPPQKKYIYIYWIAAHEEYSHQLSTRTCVPPTASTVQQRKPFPVLLSCRSLRRHSE